MAIWLAVTFYRMTSQLSEKGEEASRQTESAVEQLERLIEKLEEGVPSIKALGDRIDSEIAQLKRELHGELASMADKMVQADGELRELRHEVRALLGGVGKVASQGDESE